MNKYNFFADGSYLGCFQGKDHDEAHDNMLKCFDEHDLAGYYNISIEKCDGEIVDVDKSLSLCFLKTFGV